MPVSQNAQTPVLLATGMSQIPSEGPKAVPITIDFSQGLSQTLDYGNMQRQGFLAMLQTIFIDNSNSDQTITVAIGNNSGQNLIAKGRTQGYYAAICPNPIRLTFSCGDATNKAPMLLVNYPIQSAQWPSQ